MKVERKASYKFSKEEMEILKKARCIMENLTKNTKHNFPKSVECDLEIIIEGCAFTDTAIMYEDGTKIELSNYRYWQC